MERLYSLRGLICSLVLAFLAYSSFEVGNAQVVDETNEKHGQQRDDLSHFPRPWPYLHPYPRPFLRPYPFPYLRPHPRPDPLPFPFPPHHHHRRHNHRRRHHWNVLPPFLHGPPAAAPMPEVGPISEGPTLAPTPPEGSEPSPSPETPPEESEPSPSPSNPPEESEPSPSPSTSPYEPEPSPTPSTTPEEPELAPSPSTPEEPEPTPSPTTSTPTPSPPLQAPSPESRGPEPGEVTPPAPSPEQQGKGDFPTFNVLDYGAIGDGNTDDTKAFQDAWEASCNVEASTMVVPVGHIFLVGPLSFAGQDCQENIAVQLDGTVVAPTDAQTWGHHKDLQHWIHFSDLSGLVVRGNGTLDGKGAAWWHRYTDDLEDGELPRTRPAAMRFSKCENVTFSGIKVQDSPNFHVVFDDCTGVLVHDVSISSPGDSPNTDGIHLGGSHDVVIRNSDLACGDDCISISNGCSGIRIHDVTCGPGHGISIGSLGKDHSQACVSNITVQGVHMHNTMNGVRIKTWQGGSGLVHGVKFSNIQVSEVRYPIVIDQFYCDKESCKNQSSAVAVRGVTYENITGTYTRKPIDLACSDAVPCQNITLSAINLKLAERHDHHYGGPFCWQTFGTLDTPIVPEIDCIQIGNPSAHRVGPDANICS